MLAPQGQRKRVSDLSSAESEGALWYLVVRASGRGNKSLWHVI